MPYFRFGAGREGRKRAEIRHSSSTHRDTTFFVRVPRYDLLPPRSEIRHSSSALQDMMFFIGAPRYDLIPLSRQYIDFCII